MVRDARGRVCVQPHAEDLACGGVVGEERHGGGEERECRGGAREVDDEDGVGGPGGGRLRFGGAVEGGEGAGVVGLEDGEGLRAEEGCAVFRREAQGAGEGDEVLWA